MKTTLKEIETYLKSTAKDSGTEGLCPFCGEDEWGISGTLLESDQVGQDRETDLHQINLFVQTTALIDPNSIVPIFLLVCNKCGFVRHQSLLRYKMWLEKTRGIAEGNQDEPNDG